MTKSAIGMCYRQSVPNSANKNITMQVTRRLKRNDVLEKARKRRLSIRDVILPAMTPVYLNEHLCPEMKKLLSQTTAEKKKQAERLCWLGMGISLFKKPRENNTPRGTAKAFYVLMYL